MEKIEKDKLEKPLPEVDVLGLEATRHELAPSSDVSRFCPPPVPQQLDTTSHSMDLTETPATPAEDLLVEATSMAHAALPKERTVCRCLPWGTFRAGLFF